MGTLDCFKVFKKGEDPKHLKVYQPGESFGELALLYNAPRAATIRAKTDSVMFSLDRETFNHIVKDAAAKKREYYESFLSKVELLKDMDPYERMQIADALKRSEYKKGDYILKEGN
jgi:cAMP-dependent protein kinase regulator